MGCGCRFSLRPWNLQFPPTALCSIYWKLLYCVNVLDESPSLSSIIVSYQGCLRVYIFADFKIVSLRLRPVEVS